ncbi:MAG: hypothetical protein OXO52_11805 [Rhodospirillales bacterium]|nr:hypothetical protein [Rhodospirillales bacterium]MDE0377869.1 hypothetical protein [Rhodospirillales bacterium]
MNVPFIHRTALTMEEFAFQLDRWIELETPEYPILYLGYHGEAGNISLAEGYDGILNQVTFEAMTSQLAKRCLNRVVHFASCSTLDLETPVANNFLVQTAASAVSGYTEEVDWIQSLAFDLMYLERMQYGGMYNLTPNVMNGCRDALMHESPYISLRRHLGFRLHVYK